MRRLDAVAAGASRTLARHGLLSHILTCSRGFAAATHGRNREAASFLVRGKDADIGKLGGAILSSVRGSRPVHLDAVGNDAVSNAVKSVAMANRFSDANCVCFTPCMETDAAGSHEGGTRFIRLVVTVLDGLPVFNETSKGGIFVPSSPVKAAAAQPQAGHGAAVTAATPTDLSRTLLGEWVRFAAPGVRYAERAAAAARSTGGDPDAAAAAARSEIPRTPVGRQREPFVIAVGPPAISRAAKALAFAHGDLCKEKRFVDVPRFLVVANFDEDIRKDRYTGQEKVTRQLVMHLVHADPARARHRSAI